MAFGIDDALTAAAKGVSLTETIVQTIKRYRAKNKDYDLELLLEQVRITALERINDADAALNQFERMLIHRKVDPSRRLQDIIAETPFWHAWEQHRLSQIQKRFDHFSDSIYSAVDDIAALVRCRQRTEEMGGVVVETSRSKREFQTKLLDAKSLKEAIALLREQIDKQKAALSS